MDKLIDITSKPVAGLIDHLLVDRSTQKNIIWATDTYNAFGIGFCDKDHMTSMSLIRHVESIKPRIEKSLEDQQYRTRKKAEVFTPSWVCNVMNNYLDEDWFRRKNVFNIVGDDHTWSPVRERIEFPEGKSWHDYVDSRRLEITCGEAPYLVSRYDAASGEIIEPTIRRIGILDRKLRIVNENAQNFDEWKRWALRAYEASYGYEYQGDSLLIARINLLLTYVDYCVERWGKEPDEEMLKKLCRTITWNVWQMDGLSTTVPFGKLQNRYYVGNDVMSLRMFDLDRIGEFTDEFPTTEPSKINNWRRGNSISFMELKERKMGKKLFDYVIGNPPYNEDFGNSGDNGKFVKPVYNDFIDATYSVADRVELIHPARFLFNAGSTPKAWNEKMLSDEHLSVLDYFPDASIVFPDTDIRGGSSHLLGVYEKG